MSKRGHYLGGHTLVPRSWLGKANKKLEAKHTKWAAEGEQARVNAESRKQAKLEADLAARNLRAKKRPK